MALGKHATEAKKDYDETQAELVRLTQERDSVTERMNQDRGKDRREVRAAKSRLDAARDAYAADEISREDYEAIRQEYKQAQDAEEAASELIRALEQRVGFIEAKIKTQREKLQKAEIDLKRAHYLDLKNAVDLQALELARSFAGVAGVNLNHFLQDLTGGFSLADADPLRRAELNKLGLS